MSKLFKLREWLTVPETAKHLSGLLEEEVTEADVLRLVLDRRLKLSVNFVNRTTVRKCKVITWEETNWNLVPIPLKFSSLQNVELMTYPPKLQALYNEIPIEKREYYVPTLQDEKIDNERYLVIEDEYGTITEICDLPMIGNEAKDVEQKYQMLTSGIHVTGNFLEGSFVESDVYGLFQLQYLINDGVQIDYDAPYSIPDVDYNDPRYTGFNIPDDYTAPEFAAEEIKKILLDTDKEIYRPASGLPDDAIWVVRTAVLREFEQSISSHSSSVVKLSDNTLLATIAALLASLPSTKQPSAKDLEKAANSVGVKVSDDSIRKALNEAKELAPSLKSA